jgi:hypothetical protein
LITVSNQIKSEGQTEAQIIAEEAQNNMDGDEQQLERRQQAQSIERRRALLRLHVARVQKELWKEQNASSMSLASKEVEERAIKEEAEEQARKEAEEQASNHGAGASKKPRVEERENETEHVVSIMQMVSCIQTRAEILRS